MTEAEYRAAPGINKSTLWELRRSPAHYRHLIQHPREDTLALRLGRAVHCAVLQPTRYRREYAILPEGLDKRTKAGKEAAARFEAENAGRTILTPDDGAMIRGIVRSIRNTPEAVRLLKGAKREKPFFWTDPDTGLTCKCLVDAVKPGAIVDLKTTTDAGTEAFTRDALRHGYHVQAAHYIQGVQAHNADEPIEWYFIVVEKNAPYAVNVLRADESFIDHGRWQRMELMDVLRGCIERDAWPGYGANDLVLPSWAEVV